MLNQFSRTQLIYGVDAMGKLASSRVAVFGIGGVGGYVVEQGNALKEGISPAPRLSLLQ